MAQGDLKKLIEDARDLLLVDTEWYRTFLDVQAHTYRNSVRNVKTELIKEIGQDFYEQNKKALDGHIKTYVSDLYIRIAKTKRSAYDIVERPGSNASSFIIDIIPKITGGVGNKRQSGNTIIYDSTGSDPFKRVIKDEKRKCLKPFIEAINNLTGSNFTSKSFLDTGHEGAGVAEKQVFNSLGELKLALDSREDLTSIAKSSGVLARLKLTSKWKGSSKTTTITVTDESVRANRSKATKEKQFKATTKAALQKILNNTDWVRQKGSDSVIDALFADLSQTAKAAGAIVKNNKKANRSAGSASATINYTASKTTTKDGGFSSKVTSGDVKNPQFDLSIIALINSRLPDAVRANMSEPRLVNRTGRFANSVKVIGVAQTPQGFPSLQYTYQRAPYDVFDTALGAEPWKQQGRDPKLLIDKSIRDVARQMAIGRFYTRRA